MSFQLDLTLFTNKSVGRARLVKQKLVLEIDKGLVLSTPVDTGRARSGWNVSINRVDLQEYRDWVSSTGEKSGVPGATGQSVLSRHEETIRKIEPEHTVFLSNNVPYIEFLDKGSSRQAPQGMVDKTLQRFSHLIQKANQDSKREIP